ncbi:MAG TPA: TlpA disulfide reductase family protein [Pilimelia sp.]|nr:TlpA disulfide reductase family protein [Pilimelia sp.]
MSAARRGPAGPAARRPTARAALLAVLLAAGAGACADGAGQRPPAASPYTDCAALADPPRSAATGATPAAPSPRARASGASPGAAAAAGGDAATGRRLADVALTCLTGGAAVGTGALAGPAVVNLWATWCPPCRAELPVLQRFADRTPGVHVVGVVTEDRPDWAADLGRELGLRFPQLVDSGGALRRAVGAPGLPATVLLDAGGAVRHVALRPLTDADLADLADRHLGRRR